MKNKQGHDIFKDYSKNPFDDSFRTSIPVPYGRTANSMVKAMAFMKGYLEDEDRSLLVKIVEENDLEKIRALKLQIKDSGEWTQRKGRVYKDLLYQKFKHLSLKRTLFETEESELPEGYLKLKNEFINNKDTNYYTKKEQYEIFMARQEAFKNDQVSRYKRILERYSRRGIIDKTDTNTYKTFSVERAIPLIKELVKICSRNIDVRDKLLFPFLHFRDYNGKRADYQITIFDSYEDHAYVSWHCIVHNLDRLVFDLTEGFSVEVNKNY